MVRPALALALSDTSLARLNDAQDPREGRAWGEYLGRPPFTDFAMLRRLFLIYHPNLRVLARVELQCHLSHAPTTRQEPRTGGRHISPAHAQAAKRGTMGTMARLQAYRGLRRLGVAT